jgi:outer membrane protein OmpA-like peptidoglycan-associated protein
MIARPLLRPLLALAVATAAMTGADRVAARDSDYDRLAASFNALVADPKIGTLAPMQVERARVALQALKDGSRGDRPALAYIAEKRIEIARVSAAAAAAEDQRQGLQRENDRLQLEAARRDAEQARRELERQQLQAQIHAEESERLAREAEAARAENEQSSQAAEAARAEAAQAKRMADLQAKAAALAKKEAELAAPSGASSKSPAAPSKATGAASASEPSRPTSMTLSDSAFTAGHATLSSAGNARIGAIVDFIDASPGSKVHIVATAGERSLATMRAQTVRDALVSAGVAARRIDASGAVGKGAKGQVVVRVDGG